MKQKNVCSPQYDNKLAYRVSNRSDLNIGLVVRRRFCDERWEERRKIISPWRVDMMTLMLVWMIAHIDIGANIRV